jgi:serine/threonine-protein kinase RsbW
VGRDVEREALVVPSTEAGVRSAVERCERFARRRGFISDRILQFRLVLTEALTNAYEHGNRGDPARFIHLVLTADRRRMSIRIRDDGNGFDVERAVEQAHDPDLTSSRGRGLTIVRRYVESLQATEKGNAMTLTFSRSTF